MNKAIEVRLNKLETQKAQEEFKTFVYCVDGEDGPPYVFNKNGCKLYGTGYLRSFCRA